MNRYEEKATQDLQRILEVHGIDVTEDCFCDLLEYVTAETRRSFLSGLKRKSAPQRTYKTALEAGKLTPVQQSG